MCKCIRIQGWALSSVTNSKGPIPARTSRSRATRCTQPRSARDGAPYYVLEFLRSCSGRCRRPPKCPVCLAVRPALTVGTPSCCMDCPEAQGCSIGQEHGLERCEGCTVALPHAACRFQPNCEQLRAQRRPQSRCSKDTVLRVDAVNRACVRVSPDGHNELRAKAQSLCMGSE